MSTIVQFFLNQIIVWIETYLYITPPSHNRKAMIVGSNYFGDNSLNGCLNDCVNMRNLLISVFGFNDANILKVDDNNLFPSKDNITREFTKLISLANDGDILFFHFSGHGTQVKTNDANETDGMNEVIMTNEKTHLDYITDDELKAMIRDNLKTNATIIALFDSCHSGTAMDLKWEYDNVKKEFIENANDYQIPIPGNIIMFSSCRESEVSADFYVEYESQGILSYEFIKCVRNNPQTTISDLLKTMRAKMKGQVPQLLCNSKIDVDKTLKSYLS